MLEYIVIAADRYLTYHSSLRKGMMYITFVKITKKEEYISAITVIGFIKHYTIIAGAVCKVQLGITVDQTVR